MKKFDIQSPVVIMCGISGAGKTNYALQLEKEGFSRLSIDVLLWEKAGKGLFGLPKEEQRRLFAECREEVIDKLIHHLRSGKKVVLDATHCKRHVRDEIRKICGDLKINPVFLYCYADRETLWYRLSQRKGTGPDDLMVSEEEFNDYWHGFERPQDDERDFFFFKTD